LVSNAHSFQTEEGRKSVWDAKEVEFDRKGTAEHTIEKEHTYGFNGRFGQR